VRPPIPPPMIATRVMGPPSASWLFVDARGLSTSNRGLRARAVKSDPHPGTS
jgi:hypothetical protein